MQIKLLSLDFDGTMVSRVSEPVLNRECMELIRDLQKQGAVWAINTGRSVDLLESGLTDFEFPIRPDFILTSERDVFRPGSNGSKKATAIREAHRLCQRLIEGTETKAPPEVSMEAAGSHRAQEVVQQHPGPVEAAADRRQAPQREQELLETDEVGRQPEQARPFREGLDDDRELVLLEVAQPAMDQAR